MNGSTIYLENKYEHSNFVVVAVAVVVVVGVGVAVVVVVVVVVVLNETINNFCTMKHRIETIAEGVTLYLGDCLAAIESFGILK